MDPQNFDTPHNEKIFIGIIVGLLIGGGCGYYAGWIIGQTEGIANATMTMEQQTITPPHSAHADAQANPLQNVETNPLDGVKLNPFE